MEKTKSLLQTSLERIRLQQEVYDLYRVQNLPIDVVKEKTGLSRESIYRYLRNFVSGNPNVAEQMKREEQTLLRKTTRSFRKRTPACRAS